VNNGEFVFDGDFGPVPEKGLEWPPFRTFGREYYTYQLLLDLKIGKEWAVRTEPHPRFYTDTTDTVLVAVPALLRTEWWPMISFVDFKSPAVGGTHIFRPGEPIADPDRPGDLRWCPWTKRRPRSARCGGGFTPAAPHWRSLNLGLLGRATQGLADSTWTSDTDTMFDGTYRHLLRAATKEHEG
jgi:hypothetical protein